MCEILGIDRGTLVRRVAAGTLAAETKMPGQTGAYVFERGEVLRHKADTDAADAAKAAARLTPDEYDQAMSGYVSPSAQAKIDAAKAEQLARSAT